MQSSKVWDTRLLTVARRRKATDEHSLHTCDLCGKTVRMFDLKDHMVSAHGFMRVGGQVFQRLPCYHCDKPGLYKVGSTAYCAGHKHLATARRVQYARTVVEPRMSEWEKREKQNEAVAKKRESLHRKSKARSVSGEPR